MAGLALGGVLVPDLLLYCFIVILKQVLRNLWCTMSSVGHSIVNIK